ncbi:cell division protein ZapA [Sphingomonas paeninsulae]|jgi:cell division protein ZapA|uniref:Cell division protein ZapA n=1 Tax=Sphingomonas paeninsulae TaxID=2319844 RepID=A0A494TEK1_SPHPE|nr:cell division protein ZapA [Sphingomonas paeninsulae]AYJ85734.1 cell division protein ZapA [Sphingomonas paeninsulae]
MAEVDLKVGGRSYMIACRDGGEEHLHTLARHVDRKAEEARAAVGGMNEVRQILFAALLLADEFAEQSAAAPKAPVDAEVVAALIKLAERVEGIADALESGADSA